jgi:hypothetical protein
MNIRKDESYDLYQISNALHQFYLQKFSSRFSYTKAWTLVIVGSRCTVALPVLLLTLRVGQSKCVQKVSVRR